MNNGKDKMGVFYFSPDANNGITKNNFDRLHRLREDTGLNISSLVNLAIKSLYDSRYRTYQDDNGPLSDEQLAYIRQKADLKILDLDFDEKLF